jgi:hypothetical protein
MPTAYLPAALVNGLLDSAPHIALATLSQHSLKIIIVIPVEDKRRIQILADALHDTEVQLLA